MTGNIYLFRDAGYVTGVKIGYDATDGCAQARKAAPSYSPRPMLFEAAWRIPSRFFASGRTAKACREEVERMLHSACGPLLASSPDFPRTGRDWCWTNTQVAKATISELLGIAPHIVDRHAKRLVTNDNFRNPHPKKVPGHRFKLVAWAYRELHTGRLKTQFVDDWTTPREKARRYSRNGIEEVAAFTYREPVSPEGNARVLGAWTEAVTRFGLGPDDIHYGWLREDAELSALTEFYARQLVCVGIDAGAIPTGVRQAYNRAE